MSQAPRWSLPDLRAACVLGEGGPEPVRVRGHRGGAGSAHRSGTHAGAGTPFPVLLSHRTYWAPTRARRHSPAWPTRVTWGPASGRAAAGPAPSATAMRAAVVVRASPRVTCWWCWLLLVLEHVDLLMGCGVFRLLHGPARRPSPTSGAPPQNARRPPQIGPFLTGQVRARLPRWPARARQGGPPSSVGPASVNVSGRWWRLPVKGS